MGFLIQSGWAFSNLRSHPQSLPLPVSGKGGAGAGPRATGGWRLHLGTSLVVQQSRLQASNAWRRDGGWARSLLRELRSHVPWGAVKKWKKKKKKDCIRTRTEPGCWIPNLSRYMSGNIMDTAQNPYILGYCAVLCLVAQLCLFATPWTVAHQVPLSIGILQARILEWVAVSSSRGSSQPRSPVLQTDSLPTEPPGKPKNTGGVAYPFSSWSSWPRNWIGVSCTAGGFFTSWATKNS